MRRRTDAEGTGFTESCTAVRQRDGTGRWMRYGRTSDQTCESWVHSPELGGHGDGSPGLEIGWTGSLLQDLSLFMAEPGFEGGFLPRKPLQGIFIHVLAI